MNNAMAIRVVEFRRRNDTVHQLGPRFHRYYEGQFVTESITSLLCHSVGALCVERDGRRNLLYIGEAQVDTWLDFIFSNLGSDGTKDKDKPNDERIPLDNGTEPMDETFRDLETVSMTSDQILEKVWGLPPKHNKPTTGPETAGVRSELIDNILEESRKKEQRKKNPRTVIEPSPGLLSVLTICELVASRGFRLSDCIEYHRLLVHTSNVNSEMYPYSLGDFRMDRDALELMRSALLDVRPNGFYFSPGLSLTSDLNDIYEHIKEELKNRKKLFPGIRKDDWIGNEEIYWGTELLNEMQTLRATVQTTFSVEDMGVLAHAVTTISGSCEPSKHAELVWALIVCPRLFTDLAKLCRVAEPKEFREFPGGKVSISEEQIVIRELPLLSTNSKKERAANDDDETNTGSYSDIDSISATTQYAVPLRMDGDYSADQIIGAFIDVCLRYCWIEKSWRTNVQNYGAAIPPTVLMF